MFEPRQIHSLATAHSWFSRLDLTGGLHIKHLNLEFNWRTTPEKMLELSKTLMISGIGGVKKFTLVAWALYFTRSWYKRLHWLRV